MGKQKKSEKGPEPGYYHFPATRLGSEVSACSYAAKGLWQDCVDRMWSQEPRGVLPGDPVALAETMGVPGGEAVAAGWWQMVEPLIAELGRRRVFSRGSEIDHGLDPDAIVNRRMYRGWCKQHHVTSVRKRAAEIRWENERNEEKEDAKACKSDANGDANGMQRSVSEVPENTGDPPDFPPERNANGMQNECYSLPDPTLRRCNLPEPSQGTRPKGVGELAAESVQAMAAPNGTASRHGPGAKLFGRICRLDGCGKGEPWSRWFRSAVKAFELAGQLAVIEDHVKQIEDALDPAKRAAKDLVKPDKPGAVLVSRLRGEARSLGIKLPDNPTKGRRVAP